MAFQMEMLLEEEKAIHNYTQSLLAVCLFNFKQFSLLYTIQGRP